MKKFILKLILITLITFVPIISCNYFVDPANIFHDDIVNKVAEYLNAGYIVEVPANMNNGILKKQQISAMDHSPETVIIGSSHIMYIPFEYEDIYNAGMSGSYYGDYYSIVGLLKYYDKMPKRVVIGVDPWAFLRDVTDGQHADIRIYAVYLKNVISNNNSFNSNKEIRKEFDYSKLRELYSPSYFQSSKKSFEKDGFRKGAETVKISENSNIEEKQKIIPDGRYIPAKKEFHKIPDIEKQVSDQIKSGSIYAVKKGFKDIPSERWDDFVKLLQYLLDNGIEVQLYLPAWHPDIYDYFTTNDNFSGVQKVEDSIRELGKKYNIPVHGSYNPASRNFTTEDFMDWLHLQPDKMYEDYKYIQQ